MPNVNVYVSGPLSARLDQYKDRIKISEVCQTALANAIAAEEEADRGDRLPRIISRLQSARTPRDNARIDGYEVGRDWAERTASMSELQTVAGLRDIAARLVADSDQMVELPSGGLYLPWGTGANETWKVLPDTIPVEFFHNAAQGAFFDSCVMGFVDGAADLWDIVQEELQRRGSPGATPDAEGASPSIHAPLES